MRLLFIYFKMCLIIFHKKTLQILTYMVYYLHRCTFAIPNFSIKGAS